VMEVSLAVQLYRRDPRGTGIKGEMIGNNDLWLPRVLERRGSPWSQQRA
jgi:hypothetical protein